ncbi:hypothetical protein E2C01_078150 [Portunus trituberculatus]|uniref:Uncharacterized protein n=1 Tax=Portunus trituberculatus TaxID=210409 RepID=A0A5B7IG85_PORTR|nr:hypothetical protein [Portunus trituberculatus]
MFPCTVPQADEELFRLNIAAKRQRKGTAQRGGDSKALKSPQRPQKQTSPGKGRGGGGGGIHHQMSDDSNDEDTTTTTTTITTTTTTTPQSTPKKEEKEELAAGGGGGGGDDGSNPPQGVPSSAASPAAPTAGRKRPRPSCQYGANCYRYGRAGVAPGISDST